MKINIISFFNFRLKNIVRQRRSRPRLPRGRRVHALLQDLWPCLALFRPQLLVSGGQSCFSRCSHHPGWVSVRPPRRSWRHFRAGQIRSRASLFRPSSVVQSTNLGGHLRWNEREDVDEIGHFGLRGGRVGLVGKDRAEVQGVALQSPVDAVSRSLP